MENLNEINLHRLLETSIKFNLILITGYCIGLKLDQQQDYHVFTDKIMSYYISFSRKITIII
jgi:hypothetical protein